MLSFLKEQVLPESTEQNKNTIDTGDGQYVTVSATSENARKSTMLLVGVFIIGVLVLLFMIKQSAPTEAKASSESKEQENIELAIARLTGVRAEMYGRMDEIVNKFYEFSNIQQVNVNELTKNPFSEQLFAGVNADIKDDQIDPRSLAVQQAHQVQLLSIMQSSQGNCCMIDDKILYKGDTIKSFVITEIGDDYVKLNSEDYQIVLRLTD
ncbi:MAG: hypothetical protein PHF37_08670 [Phycisphaerae bacterium]|nr:hypothetical protein [Phycisphaerae bacterium]